jgi:hypothetical protein
MDDTPIDEVVFTVGKPPTKDWGKFERWGNTVQIHGKSKLLSLAQERLPDLPPPPAGW